MRALDALSIQKYVASSNLNDVYVLLVKAQEIDHFHDDEILLQNACTVYLPHNDLQASVLPLLWRKFPNIWWVDLSYNTICTLPGKFPRGLGSLILSNNNVKFAELSKLSTTHILRLHIPSSILEESGTSASLNVLIASILPNVWAVNDDFITSADRKEATISLPASSDNAVVTAAEIELTGNNENQRVRNLVRAVQSCPTKGKFSDYFRLEILLEEYLQETCYFNSFAQQIMLLNNSSHRHIELRPFVDVYALLVLPHRLRLDLTVVLTAALMFPIPKILVRDALLITMGQYLSAEDIDQLYALPTFVKTALVCLLRRVAAKEALEWSTVKQYAVKPRRAITLQAQKQLYAKSPPAPLDYLDSRGFLFIRPVKEYLERAIESSLPADPQQQLPFSELEIEILSKLPDAPTLSSAATYFREKASESNGGGAMSAASYREWIPFAARHTVLLLTKSPSCPPLTRPQQSKTKQELYFELLPVLRAANMTMQDLDLEFTGPGRDGRMMQAHTTTSGTSVKISRTLDNNNLSEKSSKNAEKTTGSFGKDMALMGGNALPWGVGLPKASPVSSLSWKVQEVPRNYPRAWTEPRPEKLNAEFTDDLESERPVSPVFLTEECQKPPTHTYSTHTLGSFTVTQYDIGAPAPLPHNQSFACPSSPSPFPTSVSIDAFSPGRGSVDSAHLRPMSPAQGGAAGSSSIPPLAPRSLAVTMPMTDPDSPDPSMYGSAHSRSAHENLRLDGDTSITTSLADSEPFSGMLHTEPTSPTGISISSGPPRVQSPQLRRPKSGAGARPEHVSGTVAHPVLGFSADANWESKFLLASPSAVAKSNFAIGQADPANSWNFIEYAPVLLHSPAQRLSQETIRNMTIGAVPSKRTETATTTHTVWEIEGGEKERGQEEPLPRQPAQSTSTGVHRGQLKGTKKPNMSSTAISTAQIEELSRNLLKEMGTVRNLRSLQQQNDRLAALSVGYGCARKPTHIFDDDSSLALSQQSLEEDSSLQDEAEFGSSKALRYREPHPKKDAVFLTGVQDLDGAGQPIAESSEEREPQHRSLTDTAPTSTTTAVAEHTAHHIPVPPQLLEQPLKELMASVSTLDILMRKTNYPNIHISSQSVEFGKQGINANVGTTWYPLMQKNVYRLGSDALDPEKLLGIAKPRRSRAEGGSLSSRPPGTLKPLKTPPSAGVVAKPPLSVQTQDQSVVPPAGRASPSTQAPDVLDDLSTSAYFQSLLKSHAAVKKSKKAPRPLPRIPSSRPLSAFQLEMHSVTESTAADSAAQTTESAGIGGVDAMNNEFLSTVDSQASLMRELRESMHALLLSNPATPAGGATVEPSPRGISPLTVHAAPSSAPAHSTGSMSRADGKWNSGSRAQEEDELVSVGLAHPSTNTDAAQRSPVEGHRTILDGGVYRNWETFTDSSSIQGSPRKGSNKTRKTAPPSLKRACFNASIARSSSGLRLAPTVVSANPLATRRADPPRPVSPKRTAGSRGNS